MIDVDKWELIKIKMNVKGKLLDIKSLTILHGEVKKVKKVKDGLYRVTFLVSPNRYDKFNEEINKLIKF